MTELDFIFITRFLVNLTSLFILCFACYYRVSKNSTVASSFILFGVGIFIITYLLHGVDMSMEFSFGLFAVFTMLRYRTESISIKEMTYLFLVTAIALLTSVGQMNLVDLTILNGVICLLAFTMDSNVIGKGYQTQSICYERIENITPEKRTELINDLRTRTGLQVEMVEIEHIDFLRDTAQLKVSFLPQSEHMQRYPTNNISALKELS
jgi:hypothetical protein